MKSIEILLVEDNPGDVELAREALEGGKMRCVLHVVDDGEAAMAFLRCQGQYSSVPRPDMVLLDLNLPKKSGRDVLAEIKSDDGLKRIPVVVLTTEGPEDAARQIGACQVLRRPAPIPELKEQLTIALDDWFDSSTASPQSDVG